MNQIILAKIATILTMLASVLGGSVSPAKLGSVNIANDYHATTTTIFQSGAVLSSNPGTLGSVIITLTGTAPLTIYDATTSNVNLRALATSSLPVLASFPASPTVGTYTFDEAVYNGLVLSLGSGTIASSTITYR